MNPLRILYFAIFFSLLIGLNAFIYRRLVRDVTQSLWLRRLAIAAMVVFFAAVPALRIFGIQYSEPTVSAFLLSWLGFVVHALIILVAAEVIRVVYRRLPSAKADTVDPSKRVFLARTLAASAATASVGLSTYGVYRAFSKPEVTEVPIKLSGLPKALDGFTIVQLSDIHVGAVIQEKFLQQLVATANEQKPDLLAITGDLVDGSVGQLSKFVRLMQNLQSRHGTFFVSGNHDYYSGWEEWAPALSGLGFTVLRNRFVSIGTGADSFDLIGVDDWGSKFGEGRQYDLDKAIAGRDRERASVLLAHQPQNLDVVAKTGIGLQLSGHTHGGQLFPGTLVGQAIWGDRNAGLSRTDRTWLYTSRGCGFVGPPMRVGAPPEVVKIVLLAG